MERFWNWIKSQLAWTLFNNLDELKQKVADILIRASAARFASITGKALFSTQLAFFDCNYFYKV